MLKTTETSALNKHFGIADHVVFKSKPCNLPVVEIANKHATATISLQGAHVTKFQPQGEKPVLWLSSYAFFKPGKAVRGGIPVCWPWFGPHPMDANKPAHGFARTTLWTVMATDTLAGESTQIRLGLVDDDRTRATWPYAFDLQIVITVGRELRTELIVHNSGSETFTCTGALHSYFSVSAVTEVCIHGLAGRAYLDEPDDMRRKIQEGPVTIDCEVDRIYLDTDDDCLIEDPGFDRLIRITKRGSHSTVVWNPWIAKAAHMQDFGNHEYSEMVCVETANAGSDIVTLPPDARHRLEAIISVEPR